MQKIKSNLRWLVSLIILVLGISGGLTSCGSSYSSMSGGLEDEAYIVVRVGKQHANRYVTVSVDEAPAVRVRAVTERNTNIRGRRVVVTPGKHRVIVRSLEGKILVNEHVFVSSRNTAYLTVQ